MNTDHTVIAKRQTADSKTVEFYSDGGITGAMGFYIRGIRKISDSVRNWLMGDVQLYDYNELPIVIQSARKLAKRDPNATPGDYRIAAIIALEK